MEIVGIEPTTFCMRSKHSTPELNPPISHTWREQKWHYNLTSFIRIFIYYDIRNPNERYFIFLADVMPAFFRTSRHPDYCTKTKET